MVDSGSIATEFPPPVSVYSHCGKIVRSSPMGFLSMFVSHCPSRNRRRSSRGIHMPVPYCWSVTWLEINQGSARKLVFSSRTRVSDVSSSLNSNNKAVLKSSQLVPAIYESKVLRYSLIIFSQYVPRDLPYFLQICPIHGQVFPPPLIDKISNVGAIKIQCPHLTRQCKECNK